MDLNAIEKANERFEHAYAAVAAIQVAKTKANSNQSWIGDLLAAKSLNAQGHAGPSTAGNTPEAGKS